MSTDSKPSTSKTVPTQGYMDLSKWLIKSPKISESKTQLNCTQENASQQDNQNDSENEVVTVEWYSIQSGFFSLDQEGSGNKRIRIKIGADTTEQQSNECDTYEGDGCVSKKVDCGGFFKLGKGNFNHNLAICHNKEKEAIFCNLGTCHTKAQFNGNFLTLTIKPENHIEELQDTNVTQKAKMGTVICYVEFASEQTSQCFEMALRKLACVLSLQKGCSLSIHRVDRIRKIASLNTTSTNSTNDKKWENHQPKTPVESKPCVDEGSTQLDDLDSSFSKLFNGDADGLTTEVTENEKKSESISPDEEAQITMDLFNSFSDPHFRRVTQAVKSYLTIYYIKRLPVAFVFLC